MKSVLKLTVLKQVAEARRFLLSEAAKITFLTVASLFTFDIWVAALGSSYLSENIDTFMGKSRFVILSDLLFIEGSMILAIGIFISVVKAWPRKQPSPKSTENTKSNGGPIQRSMHLGILVVIAGAILMGLSIIVGTLLR